MSSSELIERIKALPPGELAAVEAFLRALPSAATPAQPVSEAPDTLADRILAGRERLRAKVATLSVHDDTRALRENGPR